MNEYDQAKQSYPSEFATLPQQSPSGRLLGAQDSLFAAIDELAARLEPILGPSVPVSEVAAPAPLGTLLHNSAANIEGATYRIRQLVDRIEL